MASSALLQASTAFAPVFSPLPSRLQPSPRLHLRGSHNRRRGVSLAASSAASPEVEKESAPSPEESLSAVADSVKVLKEAAKTRKVPAPEILSALSKIKKAKLDTSTFFETLGGTESPGRTWMLIFTAKGRLDKGQYFPVTAVQRFDAAVFHYGRFEGTEQGYGIGFKEGETVSLEVDAERRSFNSRLHSAGHLLDICVHNVGLFHLQPGKGYHFPDGPFVEYKGVIPADQIQVKKYELEREANRLISEGAKVLASVFPYEEAAILCGGSLPSYISKDSNPRIVKFGDNPGGPCGGTHVADISIINSIKVTNIRVKKGLTKVSYSISP